MSLPTPNIEEPYLFSSILNEQRHKREFIHIHKAPVSQLQLRDDWQTEKGQGHEGVFELASLLMRGVDAVVYAVSYVPHVHLREQTGNRQSQAGPDFPILYYYQPAVHLFYGKN